MACGHSVGVQRVCMMVVLYGILRRHRQSRDVPSAQQEGGLESKVQLNDFASMKIAESTWIKHS
jgi:hypothetical protein